MSKLDEIFKEVKYLTDNYVEIGILAIDKSKKGKTTILEYAIYNEYGTKNIPARPFMRHTLDSNKDKIASLIKSKSEEVAYGKCSGKKALMQIGESIRGMIILTIADASEWAKPLKISTIRKKSNLKNGGSFNDKPLIDNKFLIKSIRYQIVNKISGKYEYVSPLKEV